MMIDERLFYFIHGLCTMFFTIISVRLWRQELKTRLQQVLMGVMCYWAFLELKDLLFYPSIMVRQDFWPDLLIILDSSGVAAGCIYLLELTSPRWFSWRRALLLYSPFVVLALLFILSGGAGWAMTLHLIVTCLLSVVVTCYIYWKVRRYNRYIDNNYSNTERINIQWLGTSILILFICLCAWVASCAFTSWLADSLFQFSLILLWAPIIYYTDRQQEISIPEEFGEPLSYNEEELDLQHLQIRRGLERKLIEGELFLNPHLTLVDLAAAVGTNRTYLSNYLNQQLQTTFYDYINQLRLKRAMELLSDPDCKVTMLEIGEQSGFNSQSTFRRVFFKAHGCSASEWRQRALRETNLPNDTHF